MTADELAAHLSRHRFRFTTEIELHQGIATCLDSLTISYSYEASISRSDRPDFMVGRVAIEAKVGGSLAALTRQVYRYALSERVAAIVVVSNRMRHGILPAEINGKQVRCVRLLNV